MNKFEELQNFTRIVENGSISAAADAQQIAKSAVSRRLSDLEQRLGVELFHRTTRKMHLTDSGRSFYQRALQILEDLQEAELQVSQAHQTLSGSLRIAAPLTFGLMHLGPAINDFQQQHPQVMCDIDFNDRTIDLMQEGFDLAIRIGRLDDSSLIARRLAAITTVTCANPDYLAQHGTPMQPHELIQHHCLSYNYLDDPNIWQYIDQHQQTLNIRINPYIRANNGDYLMEAAIAGLGIIRQPVFICYKAIEAKQLIPILSDYHTPAFNAYALYPPTRHLSARVRHLVDFLAERYAGTPYWETCLNQNE